MSFSENGRATGEVRHHLVSYSINHKRSLSDFPFSEQKTFFNALKKATHHYQYKPGAVVDNTDVLQALKDGIIRDAIIDTWENEPNINQELLNLIYRNPAYRRLLRRRKSQCHPYGTHSIV